MKAIIIAGGPGTRLRPLTYSIPKPIIPICNKPFLVYQIEALRNHGVKNIILNLHYLSDQVQKLLGDGSSLGVKIQYSLETEALDTAGAVKNAQEFFDSEPMLVLNGDILTDLDYSALLEKHKQNRADITFTLAHVEDPSAFGLIVTDPATGRVTRFLEKPKREEATVDTINAGTYVINPELFEYVPAKLKYSFERQFFPQMLALQKRMYSYDSPNYWLDIGTPRKYFQAHVDLLAGKVKNMLMQGVPLGKNFQGEGCDIDPTATVGTPVILGEGVSVGAQSSISGYCSVGRRVKIGKNVQLKHCIVHDDVVIEDGCVLEQSIIGGNSLIGAGTLLPKNMMLADHSKISAGSKVL
jgi:mannose-1-phosphate guanylyltransferase